MSKMKKILAITSNPLNLNGWFARTTAMAPVDMVQAKLDLRRVRRVLLLQAKHHLPSKMANSLLEAMRLFSYRLLVCIFRSLDVARA